MGKRRPVITAILVALFAIFQNSPALADEKVLVIGIDYVGAEDERMRLFNPVRDARQVHRSFEKAGVDDLRLALEPAEDELRDTVKAFSDSLSSDDVAVIFYAGHAIQYQGENWLIAGDGETLVNVIDLLYRVNQKAKATVFIIDACRNSPLGDPDDYQKSTTRSLVVQKGETTRSVSEDLLASSDGLAQIGDLRGLSTIVFFSTEPGNVAMDGKPGKGSPFAKALAKEVRKRQSLDDMLRRVAVRVNEETDGLQSPWRQGDVSFDIFLAGMKTMVIP